MDWQSQSKFNTGLTFHGNMENTMKHQPDDFKYVGVQVEIVASRAEKI